MILKQKEQVKFKPKIKEVERKDVVITIKTWLKVIENPKGCFENKEELYLVSVKGSNYTSSTAFKHNKAGAKKLLKFIKEEAYLK